MANQKQLALIRQGAAKWNQWCEKTRTKPDLSGADLHGVDLFEANLTWADLTGANLSGADLTGANFTWADRRLVPPSR